MAHTIDCDGVSPVFFQHLARENRKQQAAHVFIPSTVVFDHGFASQWYYSTPNMELKQRHERDIGAAEIFREFTQHVTEREDIVAAFYASVAPRKVTLGEVSESEVGERQTMTTFLNKKGLETFLFLSNNKATGVLQQFLYPKGWCSTSIVATWSPRLTIIEALRNPLMLYDKTKTVSERGATHESPIATNVSVTSSVSTAVRLLCQHIVAHLFAAEHIAMNGMVLHFKVDRENRVVLLFSTSLRAKSGGGIFDGSQEPLNLHHALVNGEEYAKQRELQDFIIMKRRLARNSSQTPDPRIQYGDGEAERQKPPRTLSPLATTSSSPLYKAKAAEIGFVPSKGSKSKLVLPTVLGPARFVKNRWVAIPGMQAEQFTAVNVAFDGIAPLNIAVEGEDEGERDPFTGDATTRSSMGAGLHLTVDAQSPAPSPSNRSGRSPRLGSASPSSSSATVTPSSTTAQNQRKRRVSRTGAQLMTPRECDVPMVPDAPSDSDGEIGGISGAEARFERNQALETVAPGSVAALQRASDYIADALYHLEDLGVQSDATAAGQRLVFDLPAQDCAITVEEALWLLRDFHPRLVPASTWAGGESSAAVVPRDYQRLQLSPDFGATLRKNVAMARARASLHFKKRRRELWTEHRAAARAAVLARLAQRRKVTERKR